MLGDGSSPAYWTFQLGVEVPLFDWKRDEREALAARRSRLEDERRAEAAAVGQQLRRALAALWAHAALARRHREAAGVLEEALQRYVQRGAGFDALRASQLRARLMATRGARLRAELACTLDGIEVERLVGAGG